MRLALLALLGALLAPIAAEAVNAWGETPGCITSGGVAGVSPGNTICFNADSTITPGTVTRFSVKGSALACLRPNVAVAGPAAMTVKVWFCAPNSSSTTASCGIEAGAPAATTLDGTNGVPAGQAACMNLGSGTYLLEVLTAPAGGTTGLFFVKGE